MAQIAPLSPPSPPNQPANLPGYQPWPSAQSFGTLATGTPSPVRAPPSQQSLNSEEEGEEEEEECDICRNALWMCQLLITLCSLGYGLAYVALFILGNRDGDRPDSGPPIFFRTPATEPIPITPPKPSHPRYTRVELQGLICHSSYDKVISNPVSLSCDFVMVDIETLEPYAESSDAGATVPLIPSDISPLFFHVPPFIHPVIFSHKGSLLRQTTKASLAQILRGLRQNIVDNNAHGLALSWSNLHQSDLPLLLDQAKSLSAEMEEYHGMFRYDKYTGSPQALTSFMIAVGRLPSVTLVYQVSGRTPIFTSPYYQNFYLKRMNGKPLETLIDEEVVQPIIKAGGGVKVIISMSLVALSCPVGTVYENKENARCASIPFDTAQMCKLWPAHVQGHYYSLMTRRSNDGNSSLTEDIFFETQYTVSRKAYLMLKQLKGANVSPLAFVIQRYDLEITKSVNFTDHRNQRVTCAADQLGITEDTKSEIENVISEEEIT